MQRVREAPLVWGGDVPTNVRKLLRFDFATLYPEGLFLWFL